MFSSSCGLICHRYRLQGTPNPENHAAERDPTKAKGEGFSLPPAPKVFKPNNLLEGKRSASPHLACSWDGNAVPSPSPARTRHIASVTEPSFTFNIYMAKASLWRSTTHLLLLSTPKGTGATPRCKAEISLQKSTARVNLAQTRGAP